MYPQSHCTYSYCPPCCCNSACMWMSGYKDPVGVLDQCAHVPSITPYLQLLPTLLLRQCLHVDVRVQGCTGCFRQVCMLNGLVCGVLHVPSITPYLQLLPTLLLRQCLHVDVRVQGCTGCFRPVCTCTLNHTVPTVIVHLAVVTAPACGCQGTRMHWVF